MPDTLFDPPGERCKALGTEPEPGMWDYDVIAKPNDRANGPRFGFQQDMFTVGVFRWKIKQSGRGLRRGVVVHRFVGHVDSPIDAFNKANDYCKKMENL